MRVIISPRRAPVGFSFWINRYWIGESSWLPPYWEKQSQPSYSCHSFPVSTCTIVPNFTGSVTDLCYNKSTTMKRKCHLWTLKLIRLRAGTMPSPATGLSYPFCSSVLLTLLQLSLRVGMVWLIYYRIWPCSNKYLHDPAAALFPFCASPLSSPIFSGQLWLLAI